MNKKLLLIGGGGHCKSIIDSISKLDGYVDIGIVDKGEEFGDDVLGVPVIGCDADLKELYKKGYSHAFISVGSVGNPALRIKLFELVKKIGFKIPNIIDQSAVVSKNSNLEKGIFIGKNAVINAGCRIGMGAIINTSATLEHDCSIGAFSHIAPGTVLCGGVTIGANSHIGAKSVIKQEVSIGEDTMIGMGSVVLGDIGSKAVVYGNPCKGVGLE